MRTPALLLLLLVSPLPAVAGSAVQPPPNPASLPPSSNGYYRQPSLRGDAVVFVSEGDLWRASLSGNGHATRLTTHPGNEWAPFISPDGTMVAFSATYEGPAAAYVMPLGGGLPVRLTWDGLRVNVIGWTKDDRVMVSSDALSTLPATQLTLIDPKTAVREVVPLAQASEGVYTPGGVLIFTRLSFQGSQTARYQGGTAQNLWRWDPAHPESEAAPLTADYAGTSKNPMAYNGKVYFLSDRDGTMNLWSMGEDGSSPTQVTHSKGWDLQSATLDAIGANARIAYRVGADIHVLDLASGSDTEVPLTLDSDLDQTREEWIPSPQGWISNVDLSADGEKMVITARGKVWVVPKNPGRVVALTPAPGVRWRNAQFTPDGRTVLGLSDATGEVELTEVLSDGSAVPTPLTHDADILRWDFASSPDGSLIAHTDKNQRLWLYTRADKTDTLIAASTVDMIRSPTFSPDGKMLAWVESGPNQLRQIHLEDLKSRVQTTITTLRYDSANPVFSPDGHWLYFLSDRHFVSSVESPWGSYGPQPYFDHRTEILALALQPDQISPFQPWDELHPKPAEDAADDSSAKKPEKKASKKADKKEEGDLPAIVTEGLANRLWTVPVAPGNFGALSVNDSGLYWVATEGIGEAAVSTLQGLKVSNDPPEVVSIAADIDGYQLSRDGKRVLIVKDGVFNIVDADVSAVDLAKSAVDLSGWTFSVSPREEWRQMFVESWRLERDYFYATNMHGVDWKGMLDRYLPLVDRVRSRAELSDLIGQMVSQLSTLHTFVYGGDMRVGPDWVMPATLGADLSVERSGGSGAAIGLRVDHIYTSDPDQQDRRSPLVVPGVDVREGDVILTVDHQPVSSESTLAAALRNKAGHPVLLGYKRVSTDPKGKKSTTQLQALVTPLDPSQDKDLRYLDWEIERRNRVDAAGKNRIGYVHLRAMGEDDISQWTREYFPVFNREGLIIDVRNNRGGNIDSWILGQLLRRPWMYWSQRVGASETWNMQSAFRGPVVVLCDENTASDGEAFSEGIKRLGIGRVIGTRTWGGEVWLSGDNFLVDGGIATAAEYGVYGPEGEWLIEGHGVEPDEVVDNLPHATFGGRDAQLEAALRYLEDELKRHPVQDVPHPPWPDKSVK